MLTPKAETKIDNKVLTERSNEKIKPSKGHSLNKFQSFRN
jgi:hypothetical protein